MYQTKRNNGATFRSATWRLGRGSIDRQKRVSPGGYHRVIARLDLVGTSALDPSHEIVALTAAWLAGFRTFT